MQVDNNRNMILAIVLSAFVLLGWSAVSERYFPAPKPVPAAIAAGTESVSTVPGAVPAVIKPAIRDVKTVLSEGSRVKIETPLIRGSINLRGAQIDDIVLPTHTETLAKDSPPVRLLTPSGAKDSYFAGYGWMGDGVSVPGAETVWAADRATLTPATPVKLRWDNGAGQTYALKISIDDKYMFSVEQSVTNTGTGAVGIRPYAFVNRVKGAHAGGSMLAPTKDVDSWTMHIGPVGAFNGAANYDVDYDDIDSAGATGQRFQTKGGWLGFGETYWLAALVPPQGASVDAGFRAGGGSYQAEFLMPQSVLAPGKALTTTSQLFAGAKEVNALDGYQDAGIPLFGKAIDWGWFEIIEKPIFKLLSFLFNLFGNFGFAIIAMTFIVRGLMFPIAQRQFASMASMRAVQPKLKVLQERYKEDKPRLQQEMMKLYQAEKINPLGGCLPIFIQIPIFYALYKVLMLSIEMRHQPFIGWIKDLSAPDPANLMTAAHYMGADWFPAFLGIGVLSGLLGVTMWMQFKLNPAAPDPVQQQIFSIMPWIMMFMMAPFAAGLQLYWVVSNLLTIAQQKWLYSKHPALKEPLISVAKK